MSIGRHTDKRRGTRKQGIMATGAQFPGSFFGLRCASCQKPIPFLRDPEPGLTNLVFEGNPVLRLICPHRNRPADYHKGQVERFWEAQMD
jgi:hypothetical protein